MLFIAENAAAVQFCFVSLFTSLFRFGLVLHERRSARCFVRRNSEVSIHDGSAIRF